MKLKPIPTNLVVHTPSEEDAKELLAILHENGYKWNAGKSLALHTNWEVYESNTYYYIYPTKLIVAFGDDRSVLRSGQHTITLTEFKERYCEEEEPQPKFKVGDRVIAPFGSLKLNATIIRIDEYGDYSIEDTDGHKLHHYTDSDLVPYTEPETKPTEDMEAKGEQKGEKGNNSENSQLDLCELLKGHEGETFYSPIVGDCTLRAIADYIYVAVNDHPSYCFFIDGRREKSGAVVFFPSCALYEQYPLDPLKAWSVWQKEQKKWKLRIGYRREDSIPVGDIVYLFFHTSTDREQAIEEIKAIIEKYSKKA